MASYGFQRMADASGTLVGYSWLDLDRGSGLASPQYQALGTTTVTTSLPSGWGPFCSTEASSAAYPMFTDGTDPTTLVGFVWLDRVAGVVTQQYQTLGGSVTHAKPGGWEPGACGSTTAGGGGGGGGGASVAEVPESAHLYLFSSMVQVAYYPDWGIPTLTQADRTDTLLVPPGYDGADYVRLAVVLKHVTAPLASDFVISALDVSNTLTIATITIPSGTAPANDEIFRSVDIIAGSFVDNTRISWQISSVESGNAFGCHAWLSYNLIVETPS